MKINRIVINNFRCYYGENMFDLSDGLTLIIGDNGDGKTTFFEALEWLFKSSGIEDKSESHISEMRKQQLSTGESDEVSVSITFEHDGPKELEKKFLFKKNLDGKIDTFNYSFIGYSENGVERITEKGQSLLIRCFDDIIKKYSLFKGESELNVFGEAEAMRILVNTFSEVKQFDSLLELSNSFVKKAEELADKEKKKDKKIEKEINDLTVDIQAIERELQPLQREIGELERAIIDYDSNLEKLETNKDSIEEFNRLNSILKELNQKASDLQDKIRINYSTNLLDKSWILMEYPSILKEYNSKISAVEKERRRLEKLEIERQAKEQVINNIQKLANDATPLPWNLPDADTMKEMIDDHVCKICGRPAPEGSDAYNFMVQKLNTFLERVNEASKQQNVPTENNLFKHEYINELNNRRIQVSGMEENELSKVYETVKHDIELASFRKNDLDKVSAKIEEIKAGKERLYLEVQDKGLTDIDFENDFANLRGLLIQKSNTSLKLEKNRLKEKELLSKLDEYKTRKASIVPSTNMAQTYNKIYFVFHTINQAIRSAKDSNLFNFVSSLESVANKYMSKLNEGDFHGKISISTSSTGSTSIKLISNNGTVITKPNEAQNTTMYMSVLFAVSEITSLKRDQNYPLIFDAPTSSFGEYKESVFYNHINDLEKQCIIVTKDLLMIDPKTKEKKLNMETINKLNCSVYRIEKDSGYDQNDLSTLKINVTPIK